MDDVFGEGGGPDPQDRQPFFAGWWNTVAWIDLEYISELGFSKIMLGSYKVG